MFATFDPAATHRRERSSLCFILSRFWLHVPHLCFVCLLSQVPDGTVMFGAGDADENWMQSWPLQSGNYKTFLLHSMDQPYIMVAESETFSVRPDPATLRAVEEAVAAAENNIWDLLRRDQPLGPKFVRLGFHDCVRGCDGCVDLSNPNNGGLDLPIAALEMIVADHENLSIGFSRADIWAFAALLGADMAQQGNDRVDFSMQWVG
jgi:hypothetical protein